jgi:hypothetical protein
LGKGCGKGLLAGLPARGSGFGEACLRLLALFGDATLFEAANFAFADEGRAFRRRDLALAREPGFVALALTFAFAAAVFFFPREALAFAAPVLGFGVGLLALRFAGLVLTVAFREGAGLAAALPRLVVFAMVLLLSASGRRLRPSLKDCPRL